MKKIGFGRLGLAFAGSFLGAGYVSGQELWQFFGCFGIKGMAGLFIAVFLLFIVGVMLLRLNRLTGYADTDRLVVSRNIPALRISVTVLETVYLFGMVVIMTAGVGALVNQLFALPQWIIALAFAIITAAVSLGGFSGMVNAFSVTVPVLAAVALGFGIICTVQNGVCLPEAGSTGTNPLLASWKIAAVTFACFNIFGSIPIVAPLGEHIRSDVHCIGGIALGSLILFLIAAGVLLSVGAYPAVTGAELPMLALASGISPYLGYVYALLLLLAMFGTALSSLVAFTNLLCLKSERLSKNRAPFVVLTSVLAFFGSLFGFGELIGVIYPVFGYLSSVFIVLLAIHYFKLRRKGRA
ncbi:MAG: hypothetical protein HUJ66_02335 [Oscillospiraceae bacterium]|nr:hypothetical protein [Oscillospiraceae bacterium]